MLALGIALRYEDRLVPTLCTELFPSSLTRKLEEHVASDPIFSLSSVEVKRNLDGRCGGFWLASQ